MKKNFMLCLIMSLFFVVTGCSSSADAPTKINNGEKIFKKTPELFNVELDLNERESFFIDNTSMMEVIEDGYKKRNQFVEKNHFVFDIDYSFLRQKGSESEKKYDKKDLSILTNYIENNIKKNKIRETNNENNSPNYSVNLKIEKCLMFDKGLFDKEILLEYNVKIVKNEEILNSFPGVVIMKKIKSSPKDKINNFIIKEISDILENISNNKEINKSEKFNNTDNLKKYSKLGPALMDYQLIRRLSKEEEDCTIEYTIPINWARFFYFRR